MPEQLALTRLLNQLFGGLFAALLNTVGIHAKPETAINDAFALQLVVVAILIAMHHGYY